MDTPNGIRAYTHVHHTGPVIEMSWDIQERIEYINTWKHEEERPLRLALIKDVTDELPHSKAWDALNMAWVTYLKSFDVEAWHKEHCHPRCPWDGKTIFAKGTGIEVLDGAA